MIRVLAGTEVARAQADARDRWLNAVTNSCALKEADAKAFADRWWPQADEQ